MGETAEATSLGVQYEIRPEVGSNGVITFLVSARYHDPYVGDADRQVLPRRLISGICTSESDVFTDGPFRWQNSRDTRFAIRLVRRCVHADLPNDKSVIVPYLETQLWSSDFQGELRHISILKEGRIFDIAPSLQRKTLPSAEAQVLMLAKEGYEVVSILLTVVDLVAMTHGELSVGRFLVKFVVGQVVDSAVNAGFDYLIDKAGTRVEIQHDGWVLHCRLCGATFFVPALADGQIVKCPGPHCIGRARITLTSH
jgi:hypothetical protein